jgi:tetratricopeptide (TPR) repeat protein/DNA-binding CsgD family transcriptional regulator
MKSTIIQLEQQLAITTDARERITVLGRIAEYIHRSDPQRAIAHLNESLALANSTGDESTIATVLQKISICLISISRYADSLDYSRRAADIFLSIGKQDRYAEVLTNMARAYNEAGETAESIRCFRESLGIFETLDIVLWQARVMTLMIAPYIRIGDYATALEAGQRAFSFFEAQNNLFESAMALNNIAVVYQYMYEFDKAIEILEKCLRIRRELNDVQGEISTLTNIAQVYLEKHEPAAALNYLFQVEQLLPALQRNKEVGIYGQIGKAYRLLNDTRQAQKYYKKAEKNMQKIDHPKFKGNIYTELAQLSIQTRRYQQAVQYLEKAAPIARQVEDNNLLCNIEKFLADSYEHLGDPAKALAHYKQYSAIKETIINTEKQKLILEIQAKVELERAERERELQQLRADRLQAEMEEKNRQLGTLALHLVQKNTFITQMKEEVASVSPGDSKNVQKVIARLENNVQTDNDWEQFVQQFEQVHRDFYPSLLHLCPTLTPAELKICSLMKLNLSNKAIASLLYIAPRTVEIHRGRIRKKLRLPSSVSLATFLLNL